MSLKQEEGEIVINNTVLISGAGGYLAGALIEQLSKISGVTIYALTSNKPKLMHQLKASNQLEIISMDDYKNGDLSSGKIDTLIHCAFSRGFNSCEEIKNSLEFTNELFMTAYENKISNIINISTQEVYGKSNKPLWHEKMTVAPESCYGIAKHASELIALDVKRISEQKTNVTNLRIASITGGTNRLRLELVSKLVMNAIRGEPITVIGGEQVLSYIDVRDVCSGIIALLSIDPNTWKEYYNLGANQQHTIMEIAKIVIDASEKLKLDPVELKVGRNDIHRIVGMDSSLFYQDTGWSPKHPLEDTVMALFEFFMENPTRNQVKI